MTNADTDRELPRGLFLLGLLLVALAYLPALDGPFVWDDVPYVVSDPDVHVVGPAANYFLQPFRRVGDGGVVYGPLFYRPLLRVSFAVDWAIGHGNPVPFHAANLVAHLASAAMVERLGRRIGAGAGPAAAFAWLWALLPRLAEAVAWISGRPDAFAGALTLAALFVWQPGRTRRAAIAAALLLVGLGFKESALAGGLALIMTEGVLAARARARERREHATGAAFIATSLAVYFALRHAALSAASRGALHVELVPWPDRPRLVLETLGALAVGAVDVFRPQLQNGSIFVPRWGLVALGVPVGCGLVALGVGTVRRALRGQNPTRVAATLALLAAVAFVSNLLPFAQVVTSDRYLYLPLGLAAALLAARITPALASRDRWHRPAAAAVLFLAVALGAATFLRAGEWADELRLWVRAYPRTEDGNPRSALVLGSMCLRAGFAHEAAAFYRRADEMPLSPLARATYGSVLVPGLVASLGELGAYDDAAATYAARAPLASPPPGEAELELRLARLSLARLDFDAAGAHAARAAQRALPDEPDARRDAATLGALAHDARARRNTLASTPSAARDDVRWLAASARLEASLGRVVEARAAFKRLAARTDATVADVAAAAGYLVQHGDLDAARVALQRLAVGAPGAPELESLSATLDARSSTRARLAPELPRLFAVDPKLDAR